MELFKSLDFFGSYLHWYVNKQKKVYTLLGGVFTIISLIICFIVLISLLNGIITRSNPQITMDDQPSFEYPKIKFGEKKIYIPWTIGDYHSHDANFTGWIYPVVYYYYGERDKVLISTKLLLNLYTFSISVSLQFLYSKILLISFSIFSINIFANSLILSKFSFSF